METRTEGTLAWVRTPMAADSLIAVALFLLALTSLGEWTALGLESSRGPAAFSFVLIALETLPLAFRRRWPIPVASVVVASFLVDRALDFPSTMATAGVVVALHTIGSELPLRTSLRLGGTLAVFLTAFTAVGAATLESVPWSAVGTTALLTALPLVLGREVYARRQRNEELRLRAEHAERDREARAAAAVAEERARIARELHDVVAHQMTVMTLQAEGARRIAGDVDPRVRDALVTIGAAGHQGLSEMRRMVGLLRTGPEDAALAPQPGVDTIEELVEHIGEAGLPTTFRRVGQGRALAPGVDVNLYRIVQEALTNALRHAGPDATASVTLHYRPDSVEVEVVDDGRGTTSTLAQPVAATTRSAGHPDPVAAGATDPAVVTTAHRGRDRAVADPEVTDMGSRGHGLVGMRERVTLLGGDLQVGSRPGGGFRVTATIPVPS